MEYKIAGHRIKIRGTRLIDAIGRIRGFEAFRTDDSDSHLCAFIDDYHQGHSYTPAMDNILYADSNEGFSSEFGTTYDGNYLFLNRNMRGENINVLTSPDGKESVFGGEFDPDILRFACWMAYGLATLPYKTLAIHASTLLYQGNAVLFLGESGTGKSTHTRLWRENIPGAELLNDDSPIIRVVHGIPYAYGSPWSGKLPCYRNEAYPLAACVRLSQAPYNKIRKLSVLEAFTALHPSCPPPFAYDEHLYDFVSSTLSDILSVTPVYHMEALPDADAALMVRDTLFGV